jgi:hypothetical protein
MTQAISTRSGNKRRERKLNVRRDTLDSRDRMFEATLIEVPTRLSLSEYRKLRIPVLDQGEEGACTGFGLATVANYLLTRRKVEPDKAPVSARMLYEMAPLRRVARRKLQRLERARRHEGLAEARCLPP